MILLIFNIINLNGQLYNIILIKGPEVEISSCSYIRIVVRLYLFLECVALVPALKKTDVDCRPPIQDAPIPNCTKLIGSAFQRFMDRHERESESVESNTKAYEQS